MMEKCPPARRRSKTRMARCSKTRMARCSLGLRLRSRPASQHEGNLVNEVGDVVQHVQEGLIHCAKQVAEEISEGVDGPANRHDESHVVERFLDCLGALSGHTTRLTCEDLLEDVEPSQHSEDEPNPCLQGASLSHVAEGQHGNSAEQQPPKHARSDRLSC